MSETRYELTVRLRTSSPIHSGGPEEDVNRADADRTAVPQRFVRDAHDKPILTGRSVKGALRAAVSSALRAEVVTTSTGGPRPQDRARLERLWGNLGRASALTVHPVDLSGATVRGALPTRAGIAVDRYWGTVADSALFFHEIVPQGEPVVLRITARAQTLADASDPDGGDDRDGSPTTADIEALFALVLGVLEDGRVAFGKRRTSGWGRVAVDHAARTRDGRGPWTLTRTVLDSPSGLLTWLDGGQEVALEPASLPSRDLIEVGISWNSPSGILVAGTSPQEKATLSGDVPQSAEVAETAKADRTESTLPLRSGASSEASGEASGPLVVPGGSIRGALRSRATRIARTILLAGAPGARGSAPEWSDTNVHDQLAADPLPVRALFGSTSHRSAVTVLDTLATVPRSDEPAPRRVTHNAGDRWTGSVADGALYSEEYPLVGWNDIRLEIDPRMLTGPTVGWEDDGSEDLDRQRAALCLLGLALAELSTGTLPLGSRGTRGLGGVRVTAMTITGPEEIVTGGTWALKPGEDKSIAAHLLERLRAVDARIRESGHPEGWSGFLFPRTSTDVEEES